MSDRTVSDRTVSDRTVLISAREAALRLAEVGVTRRQARHVLTLGFAGRPVVTRSALLYDEERVQDLVSRPRLVIADLDDICRWGVFVARRDVDPERSRREQVEAVRGGWDFSPYASVLIRVRAEQHGYLPLVATTCGFVVLGANITGTGVEPDGRYSLDLGDPGRWFDAVAGCRVTTGPGRPWVLRGWPGPLCARGRMGR